MIEIDRTKLKKELLIDAKALGIPSGSAEIFVDRSINSAIKSLQPRKIITENDLKRAVTKELKKYHRDLAYVYEIRDKIV